MTNLKVKGRTYFVSNQSTVKCFLVIPVKNTQKKHLMLQTKKKSTALLPV